MCRSSVSMRLLDCTLRDGGHITNGYFGERTIKYIIQKLVEARIDIIEVGFLWDTYCGKDSSRFLTIEDVRKVLPKDCGCSKISLMADYIDLDNLEDYDGTVEYIRMSFKRNRKEWAWKTLQILKKKGYKCFINPVNCNVYSDNEYLEIIKTVNELQPYGFSIVDTFGVMRLADLSSKYYLVENNLDKNIVVGIHLHENLGLAYSLAQHFISIHFPQRQIVIDGSLLGMGRVPGNLCIEQIMEHLNDCYGYNYVLSAAYDAIDDCIAPIKRNTPWGYTIPYALSAQNKLHRTYAEFLINKWKLKTSDIQNILCKIDKSEAEFFNEGYIESLYRDYLNVDYDDAADRELLRQELNHNNILIVAPSDSISYVREDIQKYSENGWKLIAINFIPDFCHPDYVFYTNIKRIETESCGIPSFTKIIITSNLLRHIKDYDFAIYYGRLAYHDGVYSEDSTLMLIQLLSLFEINQIAVAGFDGFARNRKNLYAEIMERDEKGEYKNEEVRQILKEKYNGMQLKYLTDSIYKNEVKGL
ncbi:MAG: homocitrate synthase [Ruminococcus flavefaciens]|nr:homocitrate synthase [Ruminococcus flavefaciens]